MTVRLPMSKRKAMGADSSGASQSAAPSGKQSRASSSGASQPAAPGAKQSRGSSSAAANDSLMEAIRSFGRVPKESRTATKEERQLAMKLRYARGAGKLSVEDEAKLAAIRENDPLMQAIRTLGRLPKASKTVAKEERLLARNLRDARREGKLSAEEEAELAAMSANSGASQPASGASQPARAGRPAMARDGG